MKQLERILWIIVGVAVIMKMALLPLAGMLLVIGLNLLSLLYFFASWLVLPTPTRKDQSVPMSLIGGIVLSVAAVGILYKVQLWPLSDAFLVPAIAGLALYGIAVLFLRRRRPELAAYARDLLRRSVPLLAVCTALYLVPTGTLTAFYFRDRPDIAPMMIERNTTSDPTERERLTHQIDSIERGHLRGPR